MIRPASARSETASGRLLPARDGVILEPHQGGIVQQPASAFTVVKQGEAIGDVAVRIYGSSDALDALWRANRDLLPTKDTPLSQGTFLRTPNMR